MTQLHSNHIPRRGRLFPELSISPEEKAKRQAEIQEFRLHCRPIFEKLRPELIEDHYNWFIVIDPESEDYFLDQDRTIALQKALEKYPQHVFFTFRLNETGICGRV